MVKRKSVKRKLNGSPSGSSQTNSNSPETESKEIESQPDKSKLTNGSDLERSSKNKNNTGKSSRKNVSKKRNSAPEEELNDKGPAPKKPAVSLDGNVSSSSSVFFGFASEASESDNISSIEVGKYVLNDKTSGAGAVYTETLTSDSQNSKSENKKDIADEATPSKQPAKHMSNQVNLTPFTSTPATSTPDSQNSKSENKKDTADEATSSKKPAKRRGNQVNLTPVTSIPATSTPATSTPVTSQPVQSLSEEKHSNVNSPQTLENLLSKRGVSILPGSPCQPVTKQEMESPSKPVNNQMTKSAAKSTQNLPIVSNSLRGSYKNNLTLPASPQRNFVSPQRNLVPASPQRNLVKASPQRNLVPASPQNSLVLGSPQRSVIPQRSVMQSCAQRNSIACSPNQSDYFQCRACSVSFSTADALNDHVKSIHKSPKMFGCPDCPQRYNTQESLFRHKVSRHNSVQLAMPLVDLNNIEEVSRIAQLGITTYVPLRQPAANGTMIGIPIMHMSQGCNPSLIEKLQPGAVLTLGEVYSFRKS